MVKTYDVTDDYLKCNECIEAVNHKPVMTKDKNGNTVFDEKASDAISKLCYDPKTSQLKPEWTYLYKNEITPIDEVFTLNQELFTNNKKDHADKVELQAELFEGACEGQIGFTPLGRAGFGYDPLFMPSGYDLTFGELSEDVKNRLSHRARAMEKLKHRLAGIVAGPGSR